MGKDQHSKDRLFITSTEWKELYGGKDARKDKKQTFKPLPFDCCALTLSPFKNPVCTPDGVVFDFTSIVPYIKKHKQCPVTGKKLLGKDLIRLNMYKNEDGEWYCPVTYKAFNNHSHIVAIRPTGNVYSYDAVHQLCLKPKSYKDLLTDEPFNGKEDIITIQNPNDEEMVKRRDITRFRHQSKEDDAGKTPTVKMNTTAKRVLEDVSSTAEERKREAESVGVRGSVSPVKRRRHDMASEVGDLSERSTTGEVSGSFTSSSVDPTTHQRLEDIPEERILEDWWRKIRSRKEKGYARIVTNLGNINVELHCDIVPRTCENFIGLCRRGYYKNTVFHRSIRNFMIQGGDPEGTGEGGESIWGEPFRDEFDSRLTHSGRGVLSMANSGKNTNTSQFFITFKSCPPLDNKHTIFGRVVGGMQTLSAMENVPTNKKEKPKEEIKILDTIIYNDPFENEKKEREEHKAAKEQEEKRKAALQRIDAAEKGSSAASSAATSGSSVGRYLDASKQNRLQDIPSKPEANVPNKPKRTGFGDFSSW
eukprot:gb/GECG01016471.1/.p1 GENE.gb/GECG01016471.1/~~gb/GECG01016471.1/.p1  ORF type:complete len:534 (+),score=84.49 gb/GECG01016471.1/:1-1602(+)